MSPTAAVAKTDATGASDVLTWQLSDLHGDISATLPANNTEVLHVSRPDEYGASTDDQPRYSWLGAKQRAGDTPAGIILMGVRLYNPTTGRFLTPDPVYGGNPNTYTYPVDPINQYDLDGRRWSWKKAAKWAGLAAMGACIVASAGLYGAASIAAAAVSTVASYRSGRRGWALAGTAAWGLAAARFGKPVRWGKLVGRHAASSVARRTAGYAGRHLSRHRSISRAVVRSSAAYGRSWKANWTLHRGRVLRRGSYQLRLGYLSWKGSP
jgi:RHS repeat-associated protein